MTSEERLLYKNKENFKKHLSIIEDKKEKLIKFKQKKLGVYKFNKVQIDILFALIGMPLEQKEFSDVMDHPPTVVEKMVNLLLSLDLVENLATYRSKKTRGDKHISMYWRLTEIGHVVALLLLDWHNENKK